MTDQRLALWVHRRAMERVDRDDVDVSREMLLKCSLLRRLDARLARDDGAKFRGCETDVAGKLRRRQTQDANAAYKDRTRRLHGR